MAERAHQTTPTMFDAVAVAYALQPDVCPMTPLHIEVDDKGFTREELRTPNVNVCLNSDSDQFFSLLHAAIAGAKAER